MPEELWIRCPRLGGEVPFSYCLKEGGNLPCPRTILCWEPFFPVAGLLKARLPREAWEACFNANSKEKISSLVELAEEVNQGKRE